MTRMHHVDLAIHALRMAAHHERSRNPTSAQLFRERSIKEFRIASTFPVDEPPP